MPNPGCPRCDHAMSPSFGVWECVQPQPCSRSVMPEGAVGRITADTHWVTEAERLYRLRDTYGVNRTTEWASNGTATPPPTTPTYYVHSPAEADDVFRTNNATRVIMNGRAYIRRGNSWLRDPDDARGERTTLSRYDSLGHNPYGRSVSTRDALRARVRESDRQMEPVSPAVRQRAEEDRVEARLRGLGWSRFIVDEPLRNIPVD